MFKKMTPWVFLLCFSTNVFAQYQASWDWTNPYSPGINWFASSRSENGDVIAYGDGRTVYNITKRQYLLWIIFTRTYNKRSIYFS